MGIVLDLGADVLVVELAELTRQNYDGVGSILFGHGHDLRLWDSDWSSATSMRWEGDRLLYLHALALALAIQGGASAYRE